jgi:uncharacterized protein YbjT (DUF2867 family)
MAIKVIITGTTGMVGEGVLSECLRSNEVSAVLCVSRRPSGYSHPKMSELLVADFSDVKTLEDRFRDFDACFFCLGTSSIGMNEAAYRRVTYDLTVNFAESILKVNPGLTFCYVSGAGTNADGKIMWAKVKGETEKRLLGMFKHAFMFRPGFMQPVKRQKFALGFYKYVRWMYPALRRLFPAYVGTLKEVARAMIRAAQNGAPLPILEVKDIRKLALSGIQKNT